MIGLDLPWYIDVLGAITVGYVAVIVLLIVGWLIVSHRRR